MFDFGMETKRLSELINVSAKNRIDDITFIQKEFVKWLSSRRRKMQIDGELYYDYEQDILKKQRYVIDNTGDLTIDDKLPNHRLTDNQYGKMVDQKVNYILSKPLTFKTENKEYSKQLKNVFNKAFYKQLKNIGKDSYNGGYGCLYPYYNENGEFKFKVFKPYSVNIFWKDDEHTEIDAFWHYYEYEGYEGETEKVFKYLDVYDKNGIHKFEYTGGRLVKDYSTYQFETEQDNQTIGYNWDRVPLVVFPANSKERPLIKNCKSLQDAINQIMSEYCDGMEENASGNSIIIIKNYDGEDLGTFRRNLSQYKAVKVRTVDGADGGIDKLEIAVNAQNYLVILQELRAAIIDNCKGYDTKELKSSGSPNEMTIKAVYSNIDLDANEIETEYQAAFEQLLWFVNQYLATTNKGNFEDEEIEVIFNRDMMVNESQIIQDLNNSSAILSKKSLISQHPWVTDVESELEQIKIEQQEAVEQFGDVPLGTDNNNGGGADDNEQ